MDSLFLLIPVALIICAVAVRFLLWAIDSGQYEDLDKEAWRILDDEHPVEAQGDRHMRGDDDSGEDPWRN